MKQLEQGYLALASSLARFGFRALDRAGSFEALYELINFSEPPAYRSDLSLNAQLAQSQYVFRSSEEYLVINGREYVSLIGMKYPPPTSLAMYLRRVYDLDFPLILRQSIGFASKQRLFKQQVQHSHCNGSLHDGSQESQICGGGEGFPEPDR